MQFTERDFEDEFQEFVILLVKIFQNFYRGQALEWINALLCWYVHKMLSPALLFALPCLSFFSSWW